MKRLSNLFVSFFLVFVLVTSANAFLLPAFLYFGFPALAVDASLLLHASFGAAVWWYNKHGHGKKYNADPSKCDITSPGDVQWLDLKDDKVATYHADYKNKVQWADLKDGVYANPTKYPKLKKALDDSKIVPVINGDIQNPAMTSNAWYKIGSNYHLVTVFNYAWDEGSNNPFDLKAKVVNGKIEIRQPKVPPSMWPYEVKVYNAQIINTTGTAPPNLPAPSPTGFGNILRDTEVFPGDVSDIFSGEIDDFIKDNPNIVHFEDSSGNDVKPQIPSTALTQTDANNKLINDKQVDARDSGNTSVTVHNQATQDAWKNYSTNRTPDNLTAWRNAQAAAAAADAARQNADAQNTLLDRLKDLLGGSFENLSSAKSSSTQGISGSSGYDANVTVPDKKSIASLLTQCVSTSPLAAMVHSFSVSVSNPVSSVTCGTFYGKEIKFDFARYESVFQTCSGVLLILVHGFAVLIVLRGW
jgi:hypothetical protein